jgi:hypothetical protein
VYGFRLSDTCTRISLREEENITKFENCDRTQKDEVKPLGITMKTASLNIVETQNSKVLHRTQMYPNGPMQLSP